MAELHLLLSTFRANPPFIHIRHYSSPTITVKIYIQA
jgi:hypothetical protein